MSTGVGHFFCYNTFVRSELSDFFLRGDAILPFNESLNFDYSTNIFRQAIPKWTDHFGKFVRFKLKILAKFFK